CLPRRTLPPARRRSLSYAFAPPLRVQVYSPVCGRVAAVAANCGQAAQPRPCSRTKPCCSQRPAYFGARFSRKLALPSRASSVVAASAPAIDSSAAAKPSPLPASISCLASCAETGARRQTSCATSPALTSASSTGGSLSSPMRNASCAEILRPVNASNFTCAGPMSLATRCVPDQPGQVPMAASGSPKPAPLPAMRMSATAASSRPPPSAWPLMAAISGSRNRAQRSNTWCPRLTQPRHMSSGSSADHAETSAPTQNALLPAPVRITQRNALSASSRVAIASSRSSICGVSALSLSGRSSRTVATGPSSAILTGSCACSGMDLLRQLQSERCVAEQSCVHRLQIGRDLEREFRLLEHVALEIHAGRDFAHHQRIGSEVDHAALGDVADALAAAAGHTRTEGDVLDAVHELARLAFLQDGECAVGDLQPGAGGEKSGEHQPFRVRGDVDESAAAGGEIWSRPQLRDVDVAVAIDLQEGQQREVEAAALEVGELLRGRHDGVRIRRATESEAKQRHAADRPLFDRPRDRAVQLLLEQNARHVGRDA